MTSNQLDGWPLSGVRTSRQLHRPLGGRQLPLSRSWRRPVADNAAASEQSDHVFNHPPRHDLWHLSYLGAGSEHRWWPVSTAPEQRLDGGGLLLIW